jgi:hypothetical protein
MEHAQQEQWSARSLENPFAEAESPAQPEALEAAAVGFAPWNENVTPFAEAGSMAESDQQRLFAEMFSELRDESFDEALAYLAEETEQAVADRFAGETPASSAERERFAETYLGGVRFEAEQYLQALETGLQGMDVQSLSEQQLDEVLDRFDPQSPGELTPAGEEFIGKLVKKAKSVVKGVVKTVGKVAGKLLGPILNKLKALIKPLLKRVLSFAIGKLPVALQPAARKLASKFLGEQEESEDFDEAEAETSPANLTDVEMLAESFDAALAEAIVGESGGVAQEAFDHEDREDESDGRELERLAEARGQLIDRLSDAAEDENLAPHIEQFVPALLGALRIGIRLVGRPKVVNFLAKFLAKLIGKWVGPQMAQPLSAAIVDTGMKLVTLEAESGERDEAEAAPVALASVVEDTVRKFAENEDYIFEDEGLMQLAASDALNFAVASNFPPRFVRPGLQQAPSLGGTFVTRRPRRVRAFRKYTRVPEIEVTAQVADDLPTFGGTTVGAALRAAGVSFPFRARLHIYQAVSGTTLPRMLRVDRKAQGGGRGYVNSANVHPLTPAAAGLLLREPKLGVDVAAPFLRSRRRIAAGQRFYLLEPLGATGTLALPPGAVSRETAQQSSPSRSWTVINLKRGRITVGIYLSETDAQRVVQTVRQGKGGLALLQALADVYKNANRKAIANATQVRIVREDLDEAEDFALPSLGSLGKGLLGGGVTGALKKKLRGWVLSALSNWVRNNAEAFARAAAHPDAGVTVRLRLTGVPGLDSLGQAAANVLKGGGLNAVRGALRATPNIAITVAPGKQKK